MTYAQITYETRGAVALVTLARPEKLNAWTPRMSTEQADAIARANEGKDKPRQIMLRADKTLDFGRVAKVMGELNRAGLTRIAIVTTGSDHAPSAVTAGSDSAQ